MFKYILIIVGLLSVVLAVSRHMMRRREFGRSHTEYVRKHKLPPLSEYNDFGQKIKWVVEPDEQNDKSFPGSAESTTGEGG